MLFSCCQCLNESACLGGLCCVPRAHVAHSPGCRACSPSTRPGCPARSCRWRARAGGAHLTVHRAPVSLGPLSLQSCSYQHSHVFGVTDLHHPQAGPVSCDSLIISASHGCLAFSVHITSSFLQSTLHLFLHKNPTCKSN